MPATIAVVLHRSPFFARSILPTILGADSALPVTEPQQGERLQKGRIYLAPVDHHLHVNDGHFTLSRGAKEHYTRPAVDPLFRSAAPPMGDASSASSSSAAATTA